MAQQEIVINPKDSVAVALADLPAGHRCVVQLGPTTVTVELQNAVPFGHKFALKKISRGDAILKYGEVIGEASADIEQGEWVHVHNIVSRRGRGQATA